VSYEIPQPFVAPAPLPASPTLRRFTVVPRLPPALEPLRELAHNLFWAWTPLARELFVRVDPVLWEDVRGNPIELLSRVSQARLEKLAQDEAFTSHLEAARAALHSYLGQKGWFARTFPDVQGARIAYFSMEYGLHESLPIYSGGLGVLAGDHLKTASDLGLPLVGVGLAYGEGYFRQALADDGWQGEHYPRNDWHKLPVEPVYEAGTTSKRLVIHVDYPDRVVHAQIWRVQVGRIPLFLLDTNIDDNAAVDRAITGPLYGGDQEFRVRQEIMLGIGGVHALEAMGLSPTVCHMNEGHSAFLALERALRLMRDRGASFEIASEASRAGNVFTTHTPVPAGNDAFDPKLTLRYLEPYRAALGISEDELLSLGRAGGAGPSEPFSMPILAIRSADHCNGVSELHGHVSRRMWKDLWPDLPEREVPIGSVTNGVHVPSWISAEMSALFTRYLGPRWAEQTDDPSLWARVNEIPDAELWQVHEHRRHRLVTLTRRWLGEEGQGALDPRALTIGFARRFATYKRANLLFTDVARVMRLLGDPDRPVQLVFAGKAHPQDRGGKELIRSIVQASREAGLRGRVVFLEDYGMRIARAMVAGVDVWLNTPRRPHEASGTSGMKAAANGALNVSVLDGWWAEAFAAHGREVGWPVGRGEEYDDAEGDRIEAELLYDVLEREVVPLFFDRAGASAPPHGWIARMKQSIARLVPSFNTVRMVKEYTERLYVPSIARTAELAGGDLGGAAALAAWKRHVRESWPAVRILDVSAGATSEVAVGDAVVVEATVALGALSPEDVAVELYHGPTLGAHELPEGRLSRMRVASTNDDGTYTFTGSIPTFESGSHAFAARVMPSNPALGHPYATSLVRWA